ncbi:hypothetical protein HDK77DRAFT_303359 [Phyllosticta capitalensis]
MASIPLLRQGYFLHALVSIGTALRRTPWQQCTLTCFFLLDGRAPTNHPVCNDLLTHLVLGLRIILWLLRRTLFWLLLLLSLIRRFEENGASERALKIFADSLASSCLLVCHLLPTVLLLLPPLGCLLAACRSLPAMPCFHGAARRDAVRDACLPAWAACQTISLTGSPVRNAASSRVAAQPAAQPGSSSHAVVAVSP